jgi:N-acetylglucosaminyldiphosphoundecaprenol N-acetyl-beta-D-mannosaminyltransferase
VDDVTHAEALARSITLIEDPQPRYVVTPNPEFVVLARRDPEFRRILNASDLAIPDGGGLLLAARLFGTPLREQVRGTDLCYLIMGECARRGWRLFLLGAAPGVAEQAAERLCRRYPGLAISGTFAGDGSPAGDMTTRAAVRAAGRSDVLFVCYGANKQERWIDRNLAGLDVGLALGLGGVLDFFSGRVRRAPYVIRRLGVDWLWRSAVQPSRFKRQRDTIPLFLWLAAREALRLRRLRVA